MGIVLWVIFGGIAGWIASLVMNTNAQQGIGLNVIVGIVGAVLGGWLMSIVGSTGVTGFNLYSFIVAIVGAVVLLGAVRMFQR